MQKDKLRELTVVLTERVCQMCRSWQRKLTEASTDDCRGIDGGVII